MCIRDRLCDIALDFAEVQVMDVCGGVGVKLKGVSLGCPRVILRYMGNSRSMDAGLTVPSLATGGH
eukprot:811199-Alexandrium_andersonii.AAC.1